jgi:hypothetical protein
VRTEGGGGSDAARFPSHLMNVKDEMQQLKFFHFSVIFAASRRAQDV